MCAAWADFHHQYQLYDLSATVDVPTELQRHITTQTKDEVGLRQETGVMTKFGGIGRVPKHFAQSNSKLKSKLLSGIAINESSCLPLKAS